MLINVQAPIFVYAFRQALVNNNTYTIKQLHWKIINVFTQNLTAIIVRAVVLVNHNPRTIGVNIKITLIACSLQHCSVLQSNDIILKLVKKTLTMRVHTYVYRPDIHSREKWAIQKLIPHMQYATSTMIG